MNAPVVDAAAAVIDAHMTDLHLPAPAAEHVADVLRRIAAAAPYLVMDALDDTPVSDPRGTMSRTTTQSTEDRR